MFYIFNGQWALFKEWLAVWTLEMMRMILKPWLLIMPERMVRVLFISSLYSKLYKQKNIDDNLYGKINQVLNICQNKYAIGVGVKLADVIWESTDIELINIESCPLSNEEKQNMVNLIIEKTPKDIQYNHADMLLDVDVMINKHNELCRI